MPEIIAWRLPDKSSPERRGDDPRKCDGFRVVDEFDQGVGRTQAIGPSQEGLHSRIPGFRPHLAIRPVSRHTAGVSICLGDYNSAVFTYQFSVVPVGVEQIRQTGNVDLLV